MSMGEGGFSEDDSSGVTEELNLNEIDTESKMKKLKKQADDAVKAQKRTEEAREKQDKDLQKMAENLLKYEEREQRRGIFKGGISPTGESESALTKRMYEEGGQTVIGQPKGYSDKDEEFASREIRDKQSKSPMGQINESRLKFLEARMQISRARKEGDEKLQAQLAKISKTQTTFISKLHQLKGLASNPTAGGPMGMINKFGNLMGKGGVSKLMMMGGIYGAIALAVYEMGKAVVETVTAMVIEQFGAGGVFDVRKMVKDEVSTIVSFKEMIDREQGMVYFSGDTSEILRQGAPQNANTKQMEYGHKQFIQMFNN